MGDERSRGKEWGGKGRKWRGGKRECTKKISQKRNIFGIWRRFLGATTPCHTFLSRDAMQARAMPSCGVCPSVTFVHMYSIKRNKDIVKKISPSGCHTILVFAHQTPWQYSNGDLLTGASNAGGVGKNRASEQTLLRAVNRSTAKCNILSCDGRWTVDDTSLW